MDTLPEEFLSAKNGRLQKTVSFGGIPNSCTDLFLQIFPKRAAKPSAGNNSACSKASQAFSGTFPGTVLNLTFSGTFSATFPATLLNLTWLCTKASPDLLQNLLRNPVEPDLALHQAFSGTFSGALLNPTWLCTKVSQTISGTFGTFSGTLLNLTRRLH